MNRDNAMEALGGLVKMMGVTRDTQAIGDYIGHLEARLALRDPYADHATALLRELTDIEGPLPGNAAWGAKVQAFLAQEIGCESRIGRSDFATTPDAVETEDLRQALERARGCIKGMLARTPVRDVAETLAEIDAALECHHAGDKS